MRGTFRALCLLGLLAPVSVAAQDREVIRLPGSLEGLPFSSAVRAGNLIFLSGQVGVPPGSNRVVGGGVAAETRQTFENIERVLEQAGSSLDRVVKCTVFLKNIDDYAEMNAVYATYFPEQPPARSTVAGSGLALGALVEIECIALAAQ